MGTMSTKDSSSCLPDDASSSSGGEDGLTYLQRTEAYRQDVINAHAYRAAEDAKAYDLLSPEEKALADARIASDPQGTFTATGRRIGGYVRRLVGSSLCTDEDAPHGMFIFVPILMILMLVLFMYRKPVLNYLSGKATPSYKGLRNIQKKAPVRH